MTKDELLAFEEEIAELFNAGKIPHPVHLSNGNEDQLIDVFETIDRRDWVLGSWRMHYQALLHGVPRETLKAAICRGESMALSFPEHRVLGSAIVGGTLPIAVGIAMGIERAGGDERVHCFLGDMTAYTGIFHESLCYADAYRLPISFVIEDNGVSVCTETSEVWRGLVPPGQNPMIHHYTYTSKYPHAGAGHRVQF